MNLKAQTEHEARQLALRYCPDVDVQIVAGRCRGVDVVFLETGDDKGIIRDKDRLIYSGPGREAGTLDRPLEWSTDPQWKRGLWLRRTGEKVTILEWDGCGDNPAVEIPDDPFPCWQSQWLGPLPPLLS